MSEKKFADGLRVFRWDNAPEFVVCQLGFKADEFEAFLRANVTQGGWVNVDVKRSKTGKLYAELNDWKPTQEAPRREKVQDDKGWGGTEEDDSGIPF